MQRERDRLTGKFRDCWKRKQVVSEAGEVGISKLSSTLYRTIHFVKDLGMNYIT
jgi:hypothetical protein